MKRIVPLCASVLCALAIGLGCGDDETTTITQYDTLIQTVTVTDSFTDTVSSPLVVIIDLDGEYQEIRTGY